MRLSFIGKCAVSLAVMVMCIGARTASCLQTLELRGNATAADGGERAVVYVGAPSGAHTCNGRVSHAGMSASLPALKPSSAGGGKWSWSVGVGVAAGSWEVHVTCQLPSGELSGSTFFTASAGPRAGHGPHGLIHGKVSAAAWTSYATGEGEGGGNETNYYPRTECTWLAEHLRPDLPFFPGPSGNAANWIASAQHAGFATGQRARKHAVVVFAPGQEEGVYKGLVRRAGQYGHVAFVKAVDGPKMTIVELNLLGTGQEDERKLSWRSKDLHFIYGPTATPPPPVEKAANAVPFYVFRTCANGLCGLQEYQDPERTAPAMGEDHVYPDGTKIYVVCQLYGERVIGLDASSTDVWDRLADGGYVSDYFVTTPEKNDQFSVPLPPCGTSGPLKVALSAPLAGATLTGTVTLSASSNAPAVQFAAYYSTTPAIPGSATWHTIGTDDSPSSQTFTMSWNTAQAPNQGGPGQSTVQIAATAIDSGGAPSGAQDVVRIAVANARPDGAFPYNVLGTCAESNCKVNLRSGPGYSDYPVVAHKSEGEEVDIVCQASGETVSGAGGTTDVWDRLTDGSWATDEYVDTPNPGGFSPPIPVCSSVPPAPTPEVHLTGPGAASVLTGTIDISATSDESAVMFEAYYSDTPGVPESASWHSIATVESTDGVFTTSWDTTQAPNQGQPTQKTVELRATALNGVGSPTGAQEERRVDVENPNAEGDYPYHVYGTCGENACELNLRSGPGRSYGMSGVKHEGEEVDIVCQAHGELVSGAQGLSDIWDKLADGSWAADFYIDTPMFGAFSPPIPQC